MFGRGKKPVELPPPSAGGGGGTDKAGDHPTSNDMRRAAGLPVDDDSPFIDAQRYNDDRFLRLAAHAANWRKAFFLSMVLSGALVAGIVYQAGLSRVEPVFIEVDKLGRTAPIATGMVPGASKVDVNKLIHREMVSFIEDIRSVSSDYGVNNDRLTRALSRTRGKANTFVLGGLKANPPNTLAETKSVAVKIKLAFPLTTAGQKVNTWQVEWEESSINLRGELMGEPEQWKANIQFELAPGKTAKELEDNPLGFMIPDITWGKLK